MKIQKIAAIGCLIAMTVSLFFQSMQVEAAKAVKTVTCPTIITLQKGKFYKVNDFLKLAGTVNSNAEKLRTKIKKGMKCRISGKGLNIKKKMFKVKKTGEYKLKIQLKKKVYVFPICVVDKTYKLEPEEVAGVKITSYVTVPPASTVKITNRAVLNQFVEKINRVGYSFSFPKTLRRRVGYAGYYVEIYGNNGKLIGKIQMFNDGFRDIRASNYTTWKADLSGAAEFYDYVKALYAANAPV